MQRISVPLVALFCLASLPISTAAAKPHVISFGKWTLVKVTDADGATTRELRIRPIFVDSKLKEYSTGNPHEITDRLFVVRRVLRLNDALPHEAGNRWQWQPGGWLLLDRVTGRISQLLLPNFDPFYSMASWYRDYVAYCGISEDDTKRYAVVMQVGSRKPILKKELNGPAGDRAPDSACPEPTWERAPARVTFQPQHGQKFSFSIRERVVEVIDGDSEEVED